MIWYFLPGVVLVGILTMYTDFRFGKIKNRHLIYGIVYALTAYLIVISMAYPNIRLAYLTELMVMLFATLVIGVVIWHAGLWTAGDAKLFFTYSFLVPMSVYKFGYMPYLSSVNILINTFVPVFLVMAFILIFRTNMRQKLRCLKNSLEPKQLFALTLFVFGFSWPMQIIFNIVKINLGYFLMVLLLFLLLLILERVMRFSLMKITLLLSVIRMVFDSAIYSAGFWRMFFLVLATFIVIRFFMLHLGFLFFTKDVDITLLEEGMIPAELIYKDGNEYKKENILQFDLLGYLMERTKKRDYLFRHSPEGLSKDDIARLKSLNPVEHLRIQKVTSFSHYIFIGAMLTMIFNGNFIIGVMNLLRSI